MGRGGEGGGVEEEECGEGYEGDATDEDRVNIVGGDVVGAVDEEYEND